MSTKLVDESGNLLWAPNDFGDYSIERVNIVTNILKKLLESTTINMSATLSESAMANVYSKEQVDNKFMNKEYAELYIESESRKVIEEFVNSGKLPSHTDIEYLTNKLKNIYSNTLGIDLDGNDTHSDSLKDKIIRVEGRVSSQEDILSKVVHVIYKNGSVSGSGVIGDLDNLSEGIVGTSLVDAINYLYKIIPNNYALSSDVETIRKDIGNTGSLEGLLQNLSIVNSLNLILNKVNEISIKVSNIESRVSNLEKNPSS